MSFPQQTRSDMAAVEADARRRELDERAARTSEEPNAKHPTPPPGWFIKTFWAAHRAVFRLTRGRFGLWKATPEKWGTLRLHTVGRASGVERIAILGYHEDGANIVTMAMNGFMEGHPAWWLNLLANPDATIELKGERRQVRARAAAGEELERLWRYFPDGQPYVQHRATETPLVVLEPR